jgi:hypothetical protein
MLFAADISTIEPYQPGRTKIPVFTDGQSYYVALRDKEKAPEGFGQWNKLGDGCGYVFYGAGGMDATD